MENLSKTCKILYDKDYLDSKKSLQKSDIYSKVKYDSWKEYETLCKEFEVELPKVIRDNEIDKWTYYGLEHLEFGLQLSNCCEVNIAELLKKLTKDKNNKWVEHISNIIGSSIRGIAKSVSYMNHLSDDIHDIFLNREVCNVMITNMIKTILFSTDDVQDGYELEKIRCFTCQTCKNDTDWLEPIEDKNIEVCFDCLEKIESN